MNKFLILVFSVFLLNSCKSFKSGTKKSFQNSDAFKQNSTGFSLVDLSNGQVIFEQNANRYYQPASNTKLFTFYAGLKVLGDSVPALKYITKGDSLIFWGTGDPSLLHPDLPKSNVIDFFKNRSEKLFFSSTNINQPIYGPGWAWDDYNDDYQAEINSLPLFANFVRFKNAENQLVASPQSVVSKSEKGNNNGIVIRDISQNNFSIPTGLLTKNFQQDVPFKTNSETIIKLLSDTLKRQVFQSEMVLPKNFKTIFSIKSDSLYKRMLHVSDNMIAEQIMLLVSKSDTLNTSKSIDYIVKTYLQDLPDKPKWKDGSGLSRYNLFTPRSILKLLEKIYEEVPQKRLYDILSEGGKTGNLKNMFKGQPPFVYAKSGSFSNNYNLSGYLIGKSGKTYAFSFMNNNFTVPMSEIRKEVERILTGMRGKL